VIGPEEHFTEYYISHFHVSPRGWFSYTPAAFGIKALMVNWNARFGNGTTEDISDLIRNISDTSTITLLS
jgi:translation elongation factor EF-1beta